MRAFVVFGIRLTELPLNSPILRRRTGVIALSKLMRGSTRWIYRHCA